MSETTDVPDDLVALAMQGDRRAVGHVLAIVRPLVVRYCRARLGRQHRVVEAAHDLALKRLQLGDDDLALGVLHHRDVLIFLGERGVIEVDPQRDLVVWQVDRAHADRAELDGVRRARIVNRIDARMSHQGFERGERMHVVMQARPRELVLRREIHRLENEGDDLLAEAIATLYDGVTEIPALIQAMHWGDIYQLLEDATDKCEHVATVVRNIMVKKT